MCPPIYRSVNLSVYLSVRLPAYRPYLSGYLPVHLSLCPPAYLSMYPSVALAISLSIYPYGDLSVYLLSTCLAVFLSCYLSIYLSIHPHIILYTEIERGRERERETDLDRLNQVAKHVFPILRVGFQPCKSSAEDDSECRGLHILRKKPPTLQVSLPRTNSRFFSNLLCRLVRLALRFTRYHRQLVRAALLWCPCPLCDVFIVASKLQKNYMRKVTFD